MDNQNELLVLANNYRDLLGFAASLSKSGFAPSHFKNAESIAAAMVYGREVGMSPMQSLQSIYVINGKPTIDAAGLKAIVQSHGVLIKTEAWTQDVCELTLTRGAISDTLRYTMEEAKKAGITGKAVWQSYPKAMLYARCVSTLIRNNCADLIKGFYSKEEVDSDMATKEPTILKAVTKVEDDTPAWLGSTDGPQDEKDMIAPDLTPADIETSKPLVQIIGEQQAITEDFSDYRISSDCKWKGLTVSEICADAKMKKTVLKILKDETLKKNLSQCDITALEIYTGVTNG